MFTHNDKTQQGTDYAAIDDFNQCMMLEMFSENPDYGKCDTLETKAKVKKEIYNKCISFDRPWVHFSYVLVLCCKIMWVTFILFE